MAKDSKYMRYRDAGEQMNDNNIREYGVPARSLFTSTKVLTLHHHIDITDEKGNIVYESNSKFLSLHNKTDITDANGRQIAHIEAKVLTLHARHYVTMADGTSFELSNELFHLVKDIFNIEGLGWQLKGNIVGLNFQLYDENGKIVAVIGQKFLSLHDKYCIDIYQPEHEEKVVAILVTLQHIIYQRGAAASGGAASSSGD